MRQKRNQNHTMRQKNIDQRSQRRLQRRKWAKEDLETPAKYAFWEPVVPGKAWIRRGKINKGGKLVVEFVSAASLQSLRGEDAGSCNAVAGSSGHAEFDDLPSQMQIRVDSGLDSDPALAICSTDRDSYEHEVDIRTVPIEKQATFLYHVEALLHDQCDLACFSCLRLLPATCFIRKMRSGKYAKFDEWDLERMCFECQLELNSVRWATVRKILHRLKAWIRREDGGI